MYARKRERKRECVCVRDILQDTRTRCHTLEDAATRRLVHDTCICKRERVCLCNTATHYNTLPHTTIYCNTIIIKFDASSRARLQNTATHCKTLQHTATHCKTLQHIAPYTCLTSAMPPLEPAAKHCNTLQHTATHCNTLQRYLSDFSDASARTRLCRHLP